MTGSAKYCQLIAVVASTNCTDYTFQGEAKRPRTAQGQDDMNHRKISDIVDLTSDSAVVERKILQPPKPRPPVIMSYTVSIFRIPRVNKLFFLPPLDTRLRPEKFHTQQCGV